MNNRFFFKIFLLLFFVFFSNAIAASNNCNSNADCLKDEYCNTYNKCVNNGGTIALRKSVPGIGNVWFSPKKMDWNAAKNYCLSHNKRLLDITDNKLQCYKSNTSVPFGERLKSIGYCCNKNQDCEPKNTYPSTHLKNTSGAVQVLLDEYEGTEKRSGKYINTYHAFRGNVVGKRYVLPDLELWFDTDYDTNHKLYLTKEGKISFERQASQKYAVCVDSSFIDSLEIKQTFFIPVGLIILSLLVYKRNYQKLLNTIKRK